MEQYRKEGMVGFNRIYIIESLPASDRRTGEQLHQLLIRTLVDDTIKTCEYHYVRTKSELLSLLDNILTNMCVDLKMPFIHFEVHGSKFGLHLESNELVTWNGLAKPLRRINYAMHNNLILTFATCYAAKFTKAASFSERAIFGVLVAPRESVLEVDVEDGFRRFFLKIMHSDEMQPAIDELNNHELPEKFVGWSSENLFDYQWQSFRRSLMSPVTMGKRIEELYSNADRTYSLKDKGIDDVKFKEALLWALDEQEKEKSAMLRHYLMDDRESNEAKFDKCLIYIKAQLESKVIQLKRLTQKKFRAIYGEFFIHIDGDNEIMYTVEASYTCVAMHEAEDLYNSTNAYSFPKSVYEAIKQDPENMFSIIDNSLEYIDAIIFRVYEMMREKNPDLPELLED